MKSFKILLCLSLLSLFIFSCTSQKDVKTSDKSLQREWMMVSFKAYSKEKLMKYQARINLVPTAESPNQYSAKMGCNNMFFSAKMKAENKIELSQVGSTMMFCQDMMDVESDFGKTLPSMTSYKVEGHYLTLSDGKGNFMKFIAADWD